jgi:hypothetical protein
LDGNLTTHSLTLQVMKHLLKQENITYTNKLDMKSVSYGGTYLSKFPEPW